MEHLNLSFLGELSDNERILLNQVSQWAEYTEEKYTQKYSFFLDERQKYLCESVLRSIGFENYFFFGGYNNSKRAVLGLFPPYCTPEKESFPISVLTFKYRKADELTHRDFLGSFMAQGIMRNTVGDILVSIGQSAVFVYDTVCSTIENITKVGRVGVTVNRGFDESIVPVQTFSDITGTVASLRLDCLLSLALRISREKAAATIKSTGAEVNCVMVYSGDRHLSEGDEFSVRGFGKFVFFKVGAVSKKERIHVTLKKYI